MIRKTLIAAALAALTSGFAGGAEAKLISNGINMNGISVNGLSLNGVSLNGITLNGLWLNGINLNGFQLNGFALNGTVERASAAAAPMLAPVSILLGSGVVLLAE